MFSKKADQSRYHRFHSIATDLPPFSRISDRIPAATANDRFHRIVAVYSCAAPKLVTRGYLFTHAHNVVN